MSSSSIATKNAIASSSSTVNRTRTGRRWFPVSCNKCHKAMDSTVFVCSCKCLFCEGKEVRSRWHKPTLEITCRISFRHRPTNTPFSFRKIFFLRVIADYCLLLLFCFLSISFFASNIFLKSSSFRLHIQFFPIEFELPGLWTPPR